MEIWYAISILLFWLASHLIRLFLRTCTRYRFTLHFHAASCCSHRVEHFQELAELEIDVWHQRHVTYSSTSYSRHSLVSCSFLPSSCSAAFLSASLSSLHSIDSMFLHKWGTWWVGIMRGTTEHQFFIMKYDIVTARDLCCDFYHFYAKHRSRISSCVLLPSRNNEYSHHQGVLNIKWSATSKNQAASTSCWSKSLV